MCGAGEEMKEKSTNIVSIGPVFVLEHGSEIGWINNLDNLSNESLLSCLAHYLKNRLFGERS